MKSMILSLISCLSLFQIAKAQPLSNDLKLDNMVEVFAGDSLKIWYDNYGRIADKSCAEFYRVGKIDKEVTGLIGAFYDYDLAGKLIFKCSMLNGMLNGKAYYYYPSGKVREAGQFVDDERKGSWRYYYEHGEAEKVLVFQGGTPLILSAYKENGTILIQDGNGKYNGKFKNYPQSNFFTSGEVKNGKLHGKWKLEAFKNRQFISTEIFEEGRFLNGAGTNGYTYTDNSKIFINGFYPNEHVQWSENKTECNARDKKFWSIGSQKTIYKDLIKEIRKYANPQNQWLMIAVVIDVKDKLGYLNVYSSNNDEALEIYVYKYIKSVKSWETQQLNGKKQPTPIFISVNLNDKLGDERVFIPEEYKLRTGDIYGPNLN